MKGIQFVHATILLLGLLPCLAYSASVSTYGLANLKNSYDFPAITLLNYGAKDKVEANPLSFVIDDSAADIQLTLTAEHIDADNTWMVDDNGQNQKIYYEVIYTTCSNGHTRATANLSRNIGTDGVNCSNHSCTIPKEFANSLACAPDAGGEGHLTIKRMGLAEMPGSADYSGTLQLTVAESP